MSRRLATALALGLFLPATTLDPAPAAAQDSTRVPTIAVFDFNAFSLTGEDAEAVGRGLAIATELTERPEVNVVDRQRIQQLIETRQLALSGRMDESRALELGKLLGAEYIVVGNVALEPERARIDLRLLDVASGTVEKATRQQGSRDNMLDLVTALADEFTADLDLPARVAAEAMDPPVEAILAYSRGLDYEQRGMAEQAAAMYRRALELFPRHQGARAALERVEGGDR